MLQSQPFPLYCTIGTNHTPHSVSLSVKDHCSSLLGDILELSHGPPSPSQLSQAGSSSWLYSQPQRDAFPRRADTQGFSSPQGRAGQLTASAQSPPESHQSQHCFHPTSPSPTQDSASPTPSHQGPLASKCTGGRGSLHSSSLITTLLHATAPTLE